jgi:hypothetical protein
MLGAVAHQGGANLGGVAMTRAADTCSDCKVAFQIMSARFSLFGGFKFLLVCPSCARACCDNIPNRIVTEYERLLALREDVAALEGKPPWAKFKQSKARLVDAAEKELE